MSVVISPIFYMGNKKKLVSKGLIDLFPVNINLFVDLFAGSGVVSMNTKANNYILNDIDLNLHELYLLFKEKRAKEIIDHIENRIDQFNLPKERTKRGVYTDTNKIDEYKQSYFKFRTYYNENGNVLDFYTLMFFAFSQQFRFNAKGEFNMPYGTDCFSDKNKEYIKSGCNFFSSPNVYLSINDFKTFKIDKLCSDDFVYLDPPYLGNTATYNEKGGWTKKEELYLYDLCERLNKNGIKFGMSNVFSNKNVVNEMLINWCDKNKWKVYDFKDMKYHSCGKKSSNTKEVYICNY